MSESSFSAGMTEALSSSVKRADSLAEVYRVFEQAK